MVSEAALSAALPTHAVQPVAVVMVQTLAAAAVTHGETATTSTLTLIKGALKTMAWIKAKTAVVASVGILLAAGTTTLTYREIERHRSWRHAGFDSQELDRQPPQVAILPSPLQGARVTALAATGTHYGLVSLLVWLWP